MRKEDLIKLGLDKELTEKVMELSKEDLTGFIPKSRFDEVNEEKKAAEEQIKERDRSLAELSEKVEKDSDLSKEIEKLKTENEEKSKEYEKALKEASLNYAIDKALFTAKAKDTKVARAAFDFSKVSLNDDGSLIGFEEQLKTVKDTHSYLFESDEDSKPNGTGGGAFEQKQKKGTQDPFLKGLGL